MVSRLRTSRDVHAGIAAALVGAALLVGALGIEADPSRSSVIGPAVFPVAISLAIIVCALGLVVRGLVPAGAGSENPAGSEIAPSDDEPAPELSRTKVLVCFGLFAGYIVAFIPAGFLVSTIVFLTALPSYIERGKVVRNGIFAVAFSVLVYLLFSRLLGVQLPTGNYTRG